MNETQLAILNSWTKRDGDKVLGGEAIAVIETYKCDVEVEAEKSGVLRTLLREGDPIEIGAVIATID